MQKITTFLMFKGQAEAAMNFYTSLFEKSSILNLVRYGPNEPGLEGTVKHAIFALNGQVFMCMDSYIKHDFTFTPSMSLFIICQTEPEIDRLVREVVDRRAGLDAAGSLSLQRKVRLGLTTGLASPGS